MSATNWDTCPRCLAERKAAQSQLHKDAKASYGKVSAVEYHSLREDYEIGITDEGEFYVIYRASCEQCDFAHEFKHEEKLSLKGEP